MQRKREYYRNKAMEAWSDINKLFSVLDNLTGNRKIKKLPDGIPDITLANDLSDFFYNIIKNIVDTFGVIEPPEIRGFEPTIARLTNYILTDYRMVRSIVKKAKLTKL